MKAKYLILLLLLAGTTAPLAAQENSVEKTRKAWEFGLGGSVYQFNRVSFSNFSTLSDGSYLFDLEMKHAVYGANLYVAHELSRHFYLDLQGTVGYTKQALGSNDKKWIYSAGLGLQWRLGEYFKSPYIDPYLRAGVSYMHKEFDILYTGTEGLSPNEMTWVMENFDNKDGVDRKDLIPISLGIGINMWFNDRWGVGLQGDYVLMPYKDVANSLQGTVRIMYRLGGKSKKPAPVIQYVDRHVEVERIIEKRVEVPVEKTVEVGKEKMLLDLFNNIYFDFDKSTITEDSQGTLNRIAEIIRENPGYHFLITGFTDSRGSLAHNQGLSERRAKAVVDALTEKGVPREILKSRGVAGRIAIANPAASDKVREGDRKVTVEIITNMDYWKHLSEKGL